MTRGTSEEGLLSRVPESVPARGPEWLDELRRGAAERLREEGFPHKKTESWRFTSVKPVVSVPFEQPERTPDDEAAAWALDRVGDDGTARVVIVNGRPRLDAVDLPDGVTVSSLAEILSDHAASLEPVLGKLAPAQHFAALNAALFEDGVVVRIADRAVVDRPLHLVHVAQPGDVPTAAYPRIVVIAGESSQAQLVETWLARPGAKHLTNTVSEIDLRDDARLDHVRAQEGIESAFHVANVAVRQGRDSNYASRVVTLGGALARLDLRVRMAGRGAECTLDGVYHVLDRDHVDHQTFIDHAEPECTSHESYRGILDDHGWAVFNGIIAVRRDAQHSNAHQENRNLLLSDDATVHTKPHLEIDADDVSCSHGATIGAIDEDQLFYLRTRGIEEDEARDILTFAFVRELLDRIPHEPVAHRLAERVLDRLPNGDAIRELVR